jgi:uncharacterized protein
MRSAGLVLENPWPAIRTRRDGDVTLGEVSTLELPRPPMPPFDAEMASTKVRMAEDAWNSRDPQRVSLACAVESRWRDGLEVQTGRTQIVQFLIRKWARELEYRRVNELWTCAESRIAVRFACEYRDACGNWLRSCGHESWQFDERGLITLRYASVDDVAIAPNERKLLWRPGRRPDDHPGLTSLGL